MDRRPTEPPGEPPAGDLTHEMIDALAAINGRAQFVRRRVRRVRRLDREHIAADMDRIEADAARLADLIAAYRHQARRPG